MLKTNRGTNALTRRLCAVAVFCLMGISMCGSGQEPGDIPGLDPALAETPPPASWTGDVLAPEMTFGELLESGGWAMWPLGLFSVAVIALAIYNLLALRLVEFCPPRLVEELRADMSAFDLRHALDRVRRDASYLGRMLSRSLPSIDSTDRRTLGREKFQESIADFALRANSHYMLWVNYFSILAQAAPMLGLLGTVSGMIKAFSAMGREGMGDPTRLAGHISEALVTTACGLIIALPALFCYFVFRNRLTQLVSRCVDVADELLDTGLAAANPGRPVDQLPSGLDHDSFRNVS